MAPVPDRRLFVQHAPTTNSLLAVVALLLVPQEASPPRVPALLATPTAPLAPVALLINAQVAHQAAPF